MAAPSADALLAQAQFQGLHQGQPFTVRLERRTPGLCLIFQGPVPAALPGTVMQAIQKAIVAHPGIAAYADLSACTYLGSGAIACLMEYLRFVSPRAGGAMPVVNPHPRALTVLRMLGLSNFFVAQPDDLAVTRWFEESTRH
jgi:anti-anti-sigma regulatory factor